MIESKIKTRDQIKGIASILKKEKKTVVFTNGCFDILHYGHVKYLEDAKKLGDVLVVGLNSDGSTKKIKGEKRPLTNQHDRAGILAALKAVDFVVIFDEPDPLELIKAVSPNVLVKGGDWQEDEIVGKDFVQRLGGKVVSIPYLKGYSTTGIIDKIQKIK